ncbi:MAG TPA: ABC transporter ATP-binding protein [Mycobacteriales bacterium]|nr:ABC transporter ATP-binding protein [Mycobacteriales bacterium]
MDQAIRVRGLVVDRGGKRALHGLDCDVPVGRVTGLLGPSGGGKTTFMRCVVGVQRIVAGEVTVLGLPAGSAALRSRIGYVTQAPSVYADLTARANARYFAALQGVPAEAGEAALDEVGLSEDADRLVGRMSGGQRTRVSLACALLGDPEVLVLDEPTVGLDPVLRRDLWATFHRLAEVGSTLLVSSHVMDEAARCDELMLLREGRLVAHDTPDAIREQTGFDDLELAFLALAEQEDAAAHRTQVRA